MTPQTAERKRKLDALLGRIRSNRERIGATWPAAAQAAPADIDSAITEKLYEFRRPAPATIAGAVPAAPAPSQPAARPAMDRAGPQKAAYEAAEVFRPADSAPPPLPTTVVTPAPPAAVVREAPPASRFEGLPPLQAPVIRVAGAVVPEPPRTIGGILRAALRVGASR